MHVLANERATTASQSLGCPIVDDVGPQALHSISLRCCSALTAQLLPGLVGCSDNPHNATICLNHRLECPGIPPFRPSAYDRESLRNLRSWCFPKPYSIRHSRYTLPNRLDVWRGGNTNESCNSPLYRGKEVRQGQKAPCKTLFHWEKRFFQRATSRRVNLGE